MSTELATTEVPTGNRTIVFTTDIGAFRPVIRSYNTCAGSVDRANRGQGAKDPDRTSMGWEMYEGEMVQVMYNTQDYVHKGVAGVLVQRTYKPFDSPQPYRVSDFIPLEALRAAVITVVGERIG